MEFNSHPLTILVGIVCVTILIFLVSIGLSCASYTMGNDEMKEFYDFGKSIKVCN